MDQIKNQLNKIKDEQVKLTEQFNDVVKEYESSDVHQENEMFRKKNEEYQEKLHKLNEQFEQIEKENQKLRYALQEQMLDEKTNLLKVSKEKLDTYFSFNTDNTHNRLTSLEENSRREIEKLKHKADQSVEENKHQILSKLNSLEAELDEMIHEERQLLAKQEKELLNSYSKEYNQLADEELTEDVIQKRAKQNQVEMKIGLGWINKIGILLILFGVAAAFRYSYSTWFNDYAKGGLFSLLGFIMLFGGEWLYRKDKRVFSLGLIGGGVAVLYGSIFFSYFLLEIIGLITALLLSVLVTFTAIALSLHYQSKTVCTFGLVGGYIPFYSYLISFGLEGMSVYAAMVYILILNLSILWISFQKQWNIVHYISYLLNLPSFFILIYLSPTYGGSLLYTTSIFLLYLLLTLGYPLAKKVSFKWLDVSILAINTAISCTVIYQLFNALGWEDFRGLLAVAFCLIYFGLGRFVDQKMNEQKEMMVLFYGTSITFLVLVVPFQFGVEWLALGWLIESVVIMLYANRHKLALLEKAGWVIFGLTLVTFAVEALKYTGGMPDMTPDYFHFKYFAVITGLVLVMFYYVYDQTKTNRTHLFNGFPQFIQGLKYFTLVNVWVYIVTEAAYWFGQMVDTSFEHFILYQLLIFSFLSVALGYVLKKITILYDRIVKYFCLVLYFIGILVGLFVTATMPILGGEQDTVIDYVTLGILVGFNVLIYATGRDLLMAYIRGQHKNVELYPTIIAVYFISVLTAFLHVQFQLGDVGFVVSSIYLIVAISYIVYGFKNKFVYLRRLGLGLTLLTTGKLVFFDLAFLTEGNKILAYFSFGLALLGISYIYQKMASYQEENDQEKKVS
ncbi:putative membrane protein [Alkalibacillus filiformis]|uniref:Membrane protein n=1 Tax=Alkalibacillus filiformis TaxID=200990 RepID=A0ABU0DW18_9BACI|nr:DUF2339 domain-containing protein [Alkalibacillus filiformis]MDQ0352498.1 putative membrane protein [Alkalibacillus filiformis]